MRFGLFIGMIMLAFAAIDSRAAVWENRSNWDGRWEAQYQSWVKNSWNKDIFLQRGFWQGLKVDCADAVYAMRYIFAAENNLPFAVGDGLGGKRVISNQMTRFDQYDSQTRKRKFLEYLFNIVSTRGMPYDSYPVAVNNREITSGRFILTDAKNHHSWTVKHVSNTGIPFLLFASRPAKSILFTRYEYPSMGFTFPNGVRPETHAGFRAFRKPEHLRLPVWQVPGYSLEQYQISAKSWQRTIKKTLAQRGESSGEVLERLAQGACDNAVDRVHAVEDAQKLLRRTGGRCLTASEYDDMSTPSRDARLKAAFMDLASTFKKTKASNSAAYKTASGIINGGGSYCSVKIGGGKRVSLNQVYKAISQNRLSSNPHDTLDVRWGLVKGPSSLARRCPKY